VGQRRAVRSERVSGQRHSRRGYPRLARSRAEGSGTGSTGPLPEPGFKQARQAGSPGGAGGAGGAGSRPMWNSVRGLHLPRCTVYRPYRMRARQVPLSVAATPRKLLVLMFDRGRAPLACCGRPTRRGARAAPPAPAPMSSPSPPSLPPPRPSWLARSGLNWPRARASAGRPGRGEGGFCEAWVGHRGARLPLLPLLLATLLQVPEGGGFT
jgi:hypothetical protein